MEKLDPWEIQLVNKYGIPSPTNDWDSWLCYPEHRSVYDKYKLSRKLNPKLYAGFETKPDMKCIVRPRINLDGLGRDVSVSCGIRGSAPVPFGFFAQQHVTGIHLSIDKDPDGKLVSYQGLKLPASNTQFYLWRRRRNFNPPGGVWGERNPALYWLQSLKVPYANMEMIGGTVIECHLRPSVQFWSRPEYSLLIHARNYHYGWIPQIKPSGIHDAFLISDKEDSRRLVVNGDNLRLIYEYALLIMGYRK